MRITIIEVIFVIDNSFKWNQKSLFIYPTGIKVNKVKIKDRILHKTKGTKENLY
jgi:hypothetical protein